MPTKFCVFRKRYNRAETEFINAKVNLHDKTETKDQLTEHLCSIIQQNEERKAKKLEELMTKLELADQEVNLEMDGKNSDKSKNESSTTMTKTKSEDSSSQQENIDKTESKTLAEADKQSDETILGNKIHENNNKATENEQNVIKKSETELVEAKGVVEKT